MLDRDEEAMSACSVVTRLSPDGSGTLQIWLRGRDLNPRPLGYENTCVSYYNSAASYVGLPRST
jgi:hypothetical protein